MKHHRCLFIFLCACFSWCVHTRASQATEELIFEIHPLTDDVTRVVGDIRFESFVLEDVRYVCDVYFQRAEWDYLTDLHEGCLVDQTQLRKALFYCVHKQLFEYIKVSITPGLTGGKNVLIQANAFWTFRDVTCKGVWFGADAYRSCYRFERGDRFDLEKHRHFVREIDAALKKEGYFQAQVDEQFVYDAHTKSVSVVLTVHRGVQFKIGTVTCDVRSAVPVAESVVQAMHGRACRFLHEKCDGRPYNRAFINKEIAALKQLLQCKMDCDVAIMLSEHVRTDQSCVDLHFDFTVRAQRKIVFWGNSFFSDAQLYASLRNFGHSMWYLPPQLMAHQLLSDYREKGFWNVRIDVQDEPGAIFFLVHENARVALRAARLEGVMHFEKEVLLRNFFGTVLTSRFLDQSLVKKALQDLTDFYVSEGFLDARVLKKEMVPHDAGTYELIVYFDEGERSVLAHVDVEGQPQLADQGPFVIHQSGTQPYKSAFLDEQKVWLLDYFATCGQENVRVRPSIGRRGHEVVVTWKIDEAESRLKFSKTIVPGCLTFPFGAFMREMQYQPGDVWDQTRTKESVERLSGLQVFESVHAYPEQDGADARMVLVRAPMDRQFELRTRLGVGIQPVKRPFTLDGLTYKVGGSFLIKNPTNRGDGFRVDMDVTRAYRTMLLRYDYPWICGFPWKLSVQGYGMRYCQPYFCCAPSGLYEVRQQGFFAALNRKGRWYNATVNVGVEWEGTYFFPPDGHDVAGLARAFHFFPSMANQNFPYAYIEPTVALEHVDNKLAPRRGFFTLFSCKAMAPLRTHTPFSGGLRCMFEHSLFVPSYFLTWAFRVRFGALLWRDIRSTMLNERFYLGGVQSLRGYDIDCTPPFGRYTNGAGCDFWVPQGGDVLMNASAEVRFPLFWGLSGALFEDVGVLTHRQGTFSGSGLLGSTGFGLRYETPIGPLRFDIGWKVPAKGYFDRSYAWFLTFGHLF